MLFTAGFFGNMLLPHLGVSAGKDMLVHNNIPSSAPLTPGTNPKLTPLSSTSTALATSTKLANSKNTVIAPKKIIPTSKPSTSAKVSMPGALVLQKPAPAPSPAPITPAPAASPSPAATVSSSDAGTPNAEGALNQKDILVIVNKERSAAGLPPLTYNMRLSAIAEIKAVDMINKQYFAHVAPDGTDIAALSKRYGYLYLNLGENLAMGDFVSSAEVMDGWMHSPGHRANILNKNYTEVGISAVQGTYKGNYIWFAVQEFGRPIDACPKTDETLKVTIDAEEASLTRYEAQLAVYKSQLAAGGQSRDSYNQIVADYNALVDLYNILVGKTKQDVAVYNEEVNTFNTCVGS